MPYGILTSYTVAYRVAFSVDLPTVVETDILGSYLVSNLNEFTSYDFAIVASTRIGPGPQAVVTAMTEEYCESCNPIQVLVISCCLVPSPECSSKRCTSCRYGNQIS